MTNFLTWLSNLFSGLVDSIEDFISSIGSAISSLVGFPAILPQLYNIIPSSVTSIFLYLFIACGFVGIFFALLRKE